MGTFLTTFGLGFGTVFVGLICLIFIIKLMSVIFSALQGKKKAEPAPAAAPAPAPAAEEIPNRSQFIAAVSAALATVMGTDVSGLRILSVKRINN